MSSTTISRRTFVVGCLAASANWKSIPQLKALPASSPILLQATTGMAQLLDAGEPKTKIWGYAGTVPGPLVRVRQGERLNVQLKNDIVQPTTVHWHGIRIDNKMDGVPDLTQAPVPSGETFDYSFKVPDAGTYWYHPHFQSYEQVARGLHGVLIVDEQDPPKVDQDVVIIVDDWRLQENGQIHEESFGSFHDRAHSGRNGNVLTLNGQPFLNLHVRSGERLRIRLVNVANARIFRIRFEDHTARIIALDGQPVDPFDMPEDGVTLAPAQRADLAIDMVEKPGSRAKILVNVGREDIEAGEITYKPDPPLRPKSSGEPVALADNPLPKTLDLKNAYRTEIIMTGGARSFFERAIYKGKHVDARQLVREHGLVWALNGVAGKPEDAFFTIKRGQTVVIRMVNDTRWPHGMHFHGHHFKEIERKGGPLQPYWRDTVLMDPDEEVTVAFVADNPGKWLVHCHMLEHHLGGMVTWFEVVV